jgi:predicted CoA-binding protein
MDELQDKKTLVLVASPKEDRYSNMAARMLMDNNVPVVAIARKEGSIGELQFLVGKPLLEDIHTITLYLNPLNQEAFYSYILSLHPKRVIFNPGTENPALQRMLDEKGIYWEEACTLVLLRTKQF